MIHPRARRDRTLCGRHSFVCTNDLGNRFRVYDSTLGRRSRFNVAPSQSRPVVVQRERTEIAAMWGGLVPHWAKDPKATQRPINARAETLAERPMFRELLKHNPLPCAGERVLRVGA